ncbi:uncharacterized protein TNIN_403551 [Trichonephila inaurata madagascariensis]|uniref:Uncharacterized protein n=1 Tax=Trichonephila inaurata madagascariensis TaxID=2747483 RepID=A0A8X6XE35_9ARAC|nr:uncharacterized protein TNIN_403551 [Trichonephila inaurata madagascariensis]
METQSNTPQTSGSGYGVVKRRQKVAKGVQTDEVRKRCWRHRRGPLVEKSRQSDNEGTLDSRQGSKDDISSPNSSSKSVLRRALPNVNFSTWTRASKKGSGVSLLVESYLGGVYAPFSSVRRQLTEQALARCREVGREHFEAHILSPTASMLRAVKEHQKVRQECTGSAIPLRLGSACNLDHLRLDLPSTESPPSESLFTLTFHGWVW